MNHPANAYRALHRPGAGLPGTVFRGAVFWGIVLICGVCPALAQQEESSPSVIRLELSQRCIRQAQMVLDQMQDPIPEQAVQGMVLLQHAHRLDPENAETCRLLIEAAELAGDSAAVRSALKQYVKLRPDDDVAQLKLIEQLVTDQQTLDKRMAMLARLLDSPGSDRFSDALRSRLAFRLALMHQEQGGFEAYRKRLKQALSLDSTNKAAAYQAYSELVDRGGSIQQIAAALFTLFNADPADPYTHAMLGDMLLGCGQYQAALDWYESAGKIAEANRTGLSPQVAQSMILAMWGAGQTDRALSFLEYMTGVTPEGPSAEPTDASDEDQLSGPRIEATRGGDQTEGNGSMQAAEDVEPALIPFELQAIHTVLLDHAAQAERAERAAGKLVDQLRQAIEDGDDKTTWQINLAWTCLLLNRHLDIAGQTVEDLLAEPGGKEDPVVRSLVGWLKLRRGESDAAREHLAELAEDDPFSRLGLCLIEDDAMEPEQRVRLLNAVVNDTPATLVGLIALDRLRTLQNQPTWRKDYRRVAGLFEQIPETLRRIAEEPFSYVLLNVTMPARRQYGYLQPIDVELELRNVSRVPLGVGPNSTLPARLMVFASATALDSQPLPGIAPIVVDLHRRLRLEPNESLRVPMRLDGGYLGVLLDMQSTRTLRISALFMLNPALGPTGGFTPGVLGMRRSLRGIVRDPLRVDVEEIDARLAAFAGPDSLEHLGVMSFLLHFSAVVPDEQIEKSQAIVSAVVQQFRIMPQMRRAWLIAQLPSSENTHQRYMSFLNKAVADGSELVQMLLISRLITEPDSSLMNAAMRSDNPSVREFAIRQKAIRQAVQDQEPVDPLDTESGGPPDVADQKENLMNAEESPVAPSSQSQTP